MGCEAVICARDLGTTGQVGLDCKRAKTGDIIDAQPTGYDWRPAVLGQVIAPDGTNHSMFRLVKFTHASVTLAQAMTLMVPEQDVDPLNPSPYLQYRAKYIDKTKVQALFPAFYDYLLDDLRASPSITLNVTAAQINSCVSTRTPIAF